MRPLRVCIYGGTDLERFAEAFVREFACAVLDDEPAIIVTGGFKHRHDRPHAKSVDMAALEGAHRHADRIGQPRSSFVEAWIPEPRLDERPDVNGVDRMGEADGVTLRAVAGRTPLGRRLAMVADVDVVVTIAGQEHTEVVIERALDLGRPVLPVPDADGDSRRMLERHRAQIANGFASGHLEPALQSISESLARSRAAFDRSDAHEGAVAAAAAASYAARLLRSARTGHCLVLMPFDAAHDELFETTVEPAIRPYMKALRIDRRSDSAEIRDGFVAAVESARAIVVDVTQRNLNVMYEVGYLHRSRVVEPMLYTRNPQAMGRLPLYLKLLNVHPVSATRPVDALIDDYLRGLRDSRGPL